MDPRGAAVQLIARGAPEEGVVDVQVHVPQGHVVHIEVLPILDLPGIGVQRHEALEELLLKGLRLHVAGEEHRGGLGDELQTHWQAERHDFLNEILMKSF